MESAFDPLMPLYALVHYYGMMLLTDEQLDCITNGRSNCNHLAGKGGGGPGFNGPDNYSGSGSQNRGTSWEFFGNSEWGGSFSSNEITDWDKIFTDVILTIVTVVVIAGLVAVVVIVTQ